MPFRCAIDCEAIAVAASKFVTNRVWLSWPALRHEDLEDDCGLMPYAMITRETHTCSVIEKGEGKGALRHDHLGNPYV